MSSTSAIASPRLSFAWLAHAAGVTAALGALLGAPALAWASDHGGGHEGHHGIDPLTLGLQIFNFTVLLVILVVFGGKLIGKMLRERHDRVKAEVDASTTLRNEAEARLAEQTARADKLQSEIDELRTKMAQEAEAERNRLARSAEQKAQRIQDETKFLLAQQIKQAEAGFRAEVAQAAARIAEQLVRKSINKSDQKRLIDGFVEDMQTSADAPRSGGTS